MTLSLFPCQGKEAKVAKKREVPGAVTALGDNRNFIIHPVEPSEEMVRLLFDSPLPAGYQVVKLDSTKLPPTYGETTVRWANAWGVKNPDGGWSGIRDNVGHTAFFKAHDPQKERFVYVDGGDVKDDRTPVGAGAGMMKVGFETGDPGYGWR
jgi:hypothetical protein